MQYKSFVILLSHAYFLNPYIRVLLDAYLLTNRDYKSPGKEHYRVFQEHSTRDRMAMVTVQVST